MPLRPAAGLAARGTTDPGPARGRGPARVQKASQRRLQAGGDDGAAAAMGRHPAGVMSSAQPPSLPHSAALFLDFDGTLAPIALTPDAVRVPRGVVPALERLRVELHDAVVIVSGRPLSQIDAFLHPLVLPAAGTHGAERRSAGGTVHTLQAPLPEAIVRLTRDLVQRHPALMLEMKPSGMALHYRACPELEGPCRTFLDRELPLLGALASPWEWMHGHFVYELKQRAVSKGHAVRAFLAEPEFAGRLPIFVGDDVTDEEGIRAVQAAGGFGVRVGPGETTAQYRLANPDAVLAWLQSGASGAHPPGSGRAHP